MCLLGIGMVSCSIPLYALSTLEEMYVYLHIHPACAMYLTWWVNLSKRCCILFSSYGRLHCVIFKNRYYGVYMHLVSASLHCMWNCQNSHPLRSVDSENLYHHLYLMVKAFHQELTDFIQMQNQFRTVSFCIAVKVSSTTWLELLCPQPIFGEMVVWEWLCTPLLGIKG